MSSPAVTRVARMWHLITALVAAAALVTQLVMVARGVDVLVVNGRIPPVSTRIIRFFSYFTVQSNILVAITATTLALRPDWDGRVWRVFRLAALFGILVTFVTYATLLAPLVDLHGVSALTNIGLHYVAPLMTVIGWVLFGPRPRIDENTLMLSLIWPVAYVLYSLAHGAASDWYPYPFVDVTKLGYGIALRNGLGLTVLLIGVGALFRYADHQMSKRRRA
ncbi:MAG TPA: Pr6Pr family membrane protein [Mycobacteriales bacterium]|nr:Pr6Pr family membrane protein [Mycobacteriales bacterium]